MATKKPAAKKKKTSKKFEKTEVKPAEFNIDHALQRGKMLDDLHARMRHCQKYKLPVDPEINQQAQALSDCACPNKLAQLAEWHGTLTPLNELPKVQTWDEFDAMVGGLRSTLLQEAAYFQLMGKPAPVALKELMAQLENVRRVCLTPEAAIQNVEGIRLKLRIALDKVKAS